MLVCYKITSDNILYQMQHLCLCLPLSRIGHSLMHEQLSIVLLVRTMFSIKKHVAIYPLSVLLSFSIGKLQFKNVVSIANPNSNSKFIK